MRAHIDSFSGAAVGLKGKQRTAENVLAVLAKRPRLSTFDLSEYRWLRDVIHDLRTRGLIDIASEPYPWCRYVLTDAGRSALEPKPTATKEARPNDPLIFSGGGAEPAGARGEAA